MGASRKVYTDKDLRTLDMITALWIRPQMYLSPVMDSGGIAARLAEEAFRLTKKQAHLDKLDNWFIVAANEDWLSYTNTADIQQVFRTHIHLAEMGSFDMYGEVILTAYAENVVTFLDTKMTVIKGEKESQLLAKFIESKPDWKRVVAFSDFSISIRPGSLTTEQLQFLKDAGKTRP
ncbi:MAG: hypothetical protein R3C11_26980 [Planctomycetaceae bacterium]